MLGPSRRLLVQDETDLTKKLENKLEKGWKTLSEGREKAGEALESFKEAIKLDPKDPRPHNYCGIAYEFLEKEKEAEDNYETADFLCGDDKGRKALLQNLRKWKPIHFRKRGDAEGKPRSKGTDFLISFQTEDGDFNNKALKKLSESDVVYFQDNAVKKSH